MARYNENLAVLFADITDSTRLYSTLGDNAARVVVNACLTIITDVVTRCRGRVVKNDRRRGDVRVYLLGMLPVRSDSFPWSAPFRPGTARSGYGQAATATAVWTRRPSRPGGKPVPVCPVWWPRAPP